MDISDVALSYLGTVEGGIKHKKIIDIYNRIKPLPRGYKVKLTDNWCATFVSTCCYIAGVGSKIYECGANRMYKKFKKLGWTINPEKVQKNDIIFYDWQCTGEWYDHVGIIYKLTKNYVFVVEGNKSNKVGRRTIIRKSLKNTHKYAIARVKE